MIVVTEGTKTEPRYIDEFRRIHHLTNVRVKVEGTGFDPKSVVEKAIDFKEDADADRRDTSQTQVWAVFDKDEHDRFEEARRLAKDKGIHVAISNPCFELWAIYHYQDHPGQHIERDECQKMLEGLCAGYRARRGKLFNDIEVIRDNHDAAVERAKRSLRAREEEGDPHGNPSTSMHVLMESIRPQAKADDGE